MRLGRRAKSASLRLAAVSALVAVATAILHVRGIWSPLSATLGGLAIAICGTYLVQWRAERNEPAGTDVAMDRRQAWRRDLRIAVLAHRVRAGSQLDQMLGEASALNLRTVSFELTEGHDHAPRIHFRGGAVPFGEVVAEWARARCRLVITADPGYGKTVAALTLLSHINGADDAKDKPLAELFPLVEWYRWHLDHADRQLADWLAAQLATNYQIPGAAAQDLVGHDLIIPLLDGLDEVPEGYRQQCMDAIDAHSGRTGPFRPFVLTCRTQEYRDLAPRWVGADQQVGFIGLDASEISGVLSARTLGRPGWSVIRQDVEAGNQKLLHLLRSPLRLSIVLQAYSTRDPGELLRLPDVAAESRIWDLLLGNDTDAKPGGMHDHAYSALAFLAARMQLLSVQQFRLHELYFYEPDRLSVFRRFRNSIGWSLGLAVALIAGVADAFDNGLGNGHVGFGILNGVIDGVLFGLIFGLVSRGITREAVVVRLPVALALRRTRIWAAVGVCWGLLAGLSGAGDVMPQHVLANPVANAVVRGVITATVYAVILGVIGFVFASSSSRSSSPPAALTARAPGAILAAAGYRWLLMAAGGAVIGAVLGRSTGGWVAAIIVGLLAATLCGMLGGLGTWLYHYHLRWLLARKGLLPRRLPGFLDWCAEPKRSWLRVTDGYEFRHRELLDHLAARWAAEHETVSTQEQPRPA
jgi:hypothetical protein